MPQYLYRWFSHKQEWERWRRNLRKLFSFHLSAEQHGTQPHGETEAMNAALIQLFGRTGLFEKVIVFNDSISAINSIAKSDTLRSKRVTEIHSSIKMLKGLQKDIKFQWMPSHCGAVRNAIAGYLAKKGSKISQTPSN
jgi:ribonuclease HI